MRKLIILNLLYCIIISKPSFTQNRCFRKQFLIDYKFNEQNFPKQWLTRSILVIYLDTKTRVKYKKIRKNLKMVYKSRFGQTTEQIKSISSILWSNIKVAFFRPKTHFGTISPWYNISISLSVLLHWLLYLFVFSLIGLWHNFIKAFYFFLR